jgi:hypothetical protein
MKSRPFTYNAGPSIPGTEQVGDLAIGFPTVDFSLTELEWWNGPDEDLGYVIAKPVPNDNQPTPILGNVLTLSPTNKGLDISLSNNNQTASQIFSYQQTVLGELLISGPTKVMFSVKYTSTNPSVGIGGHFIGFGQPSMNYVGPFNGYPGNDVYSIGFSDDGQYYFNGVGTTNYPTWTDGDIIDIAISLAGTERCWIRVNGGNWNNNPAANPSTNSGSVSMPGLNNYYPALCPYIYGTMEVLNSPTYGYPVGYAFLGNIGASVGFSRTDGFNDSDFISLANSLTGETDTAAFDAANSLTANGFWHSYPITIPILSLDAADYAGSGPWIDSVGGKSFTLNNSPSWSSNYGGYFGFSPASLHSARCNTGLPSLSTWSVGVWHYYDGTNTGSLPCIVTETFVGGSLNYSLGNNEGGGLSSGFFNGNWQTSGTYPLTPGNWYYIVGTYDGAYNNLYINGTLFSSGPYFFTPTTNGAGIRLMERWDSSDFWGGKLAKVDIYDGALSSGQIYSNWNLIKSRFGL